MPLDIRRVVLDTHDRAARHREGAVSGIRIGGTDAGTVGDDVASVTQALVCNTQRQHCMKQSSIQQESETSSIVNRQ